MKRILVTGTHRSGTTWVGKMLSAGPAVTYVHEPFNVSHSRAWYGLPIERWFSYYPDIADKAGLDHAYRQILSYQRLGNPADVQSAGGLVKQAKRFVKRRRNTLLIKDPLALLSADHLARAYDMKVVCMIRHPLSFCGSIKKWNWAFPFADFLAQPTLMADHFAGYRAQIERFAQHEQDIVDQGILLWNTLHSVIKSYRDNHPDWVFLRHEEATQQPDALFREAYERVGLPFTEQVRQALQGSSESGSGETKDHNYKPRDQQAVLKTWEDRLTKQEADRVMEQTSGLRAAFYPGDEAA